MYSCRTSRRLSVLTEVNEDFETVSSSNSQLEHIRRQWWTLEEESSEEESQEESLRDWRRTWSSFHTEKITAEENNLHTDIQKRHFQNRQRQKSDSAIFVEKTQLIKSAQRGWLTPAPPASRPRPLELSSDTSSVSLDTEDDRSGDSTDQTVTLKVSACSASPSSASSSYVTPIPSPLISPQSSFHSCRSIACLSSPSDSGHFIFLF